VAPDVIETAAFLLSHGMGDPRGGSFGKATAIVGSVWGRDEKPIEVRGWVLPPTGTKPTRIVTLDGLVRDVVSIGEEAKVAQEFEGTPENASRRGIIARPTVETIGLLLIAGEIDLAEKLDALRRREPVRRIVHDELLPKLFDQAITAHMRGDDRTALEIARLITRVLPDFEKRTMTGMDQRAGDKPFDYLDVIPGLIQDTERRLRQPLRRSFDANSISALSVRDLIDRLDEVAARQAGQPGGVDLTEDPIVRALIKKGNAAADSLLDVIENDKRLTRSVSFGRDFFPARDLIPVKTAAYVAFSNIAETGFGYSSIEEVDVTKLREFWKENAGQTGLERWLATLADDAAGERRWMDAAARLFDGVDVVRMGPWVTVTKDGDPIKAEALRGRSNPALSELLGRRSRELCGSGRVVSSMQWFSCANGLRLASLLEKWDRGAAQTTLRVVSLRAMEMALQPIASNNSLSQTGARLAAALEARHRLGDTEVWSDYAVWLPKLDYVPDNNETFKIFWPLALHGNEPALQGLARRLFLDPMSIHNLARISREHGGRVEEMAVTPLLAIPEVRQAILQILQDKSVVGEVSVDEKGAVMVRYGNSTLGSGPDPATRQDPLAPQVGERRAMRLNDRMALALKRLIGAPDFKPYWPEAEKDLAIDQLRSYLRANETRIEELLPWPQNWRDFPSPR
jgi:hypothetical protein